MLRPIPASLLAILGLAATTFGTASTASASEKKTITGTAVLTGDANGDAFFDELTVSKDAVLLVPAFDGAKGLGVLRIHAMVITVEQGGTISAVGAGYRGRDGMAGEASPGTMGGGAVSSTLGLPGGGGAYGGNGAPGLDVGCMPLGASPGGTSFYDVLAPLALGSAGGAANVGGGLSNHGGNGGGLILLEAAKVVIDGLVDASGATPLALGGVAPGGGSGGAIWIRAAELSGSGTLRVNGADAPHGAGVVPASIDPSNGGGGSGGVVKIEGPQRPASLLVEKSGGKSGLCGAFHGDDGQLKNDVTPNGCVDADGDAITSKACGGLDCNDGDRAISPSAKEVCNGVDDNCDGETDEGTLCSIGSVCMGGACVPAGDGGSVGDGGVDPGPRPDHTGLAGGCALGEPALRETGLGGASGAPVAGALGLAFLAAGRLRRRRGGKRG